MLSKAETAIRNKLLTMDCTGGQASKALMAVTKAVYDREPADAKLFFEDIKAVKQKILDELKVHGISTERANELSEMYWEYLRFEAPYLFDSFCLYIERNRPPRERFYQPRRKTLRRVADCLQEAEDGYLDELFIHQPPRTGKSQILTMFAAWHCGRNSEDSNLYVTYKESLGGAFLRGVQEIMTDPTYLYSEVFPNTKIVATDAKNNKLDLDRKKKYATLSGKGLESGLNGEYDAKGFLICDDLLEGIQDVLNPETLKRKQFVFDNNVMSRAKMGCVKIWNGTIWSLHDIYSNRLDFLQNNPQARHIRWKILKLPALDPITEESNFDYQYGVGFNTEYYKQLRAKFEENEDLASWMAQYQQEPIERDGAVFTPQFMHFYNGVLPEEGLYRICAACDVALGGSDFLSMPVAYCYDDGSVYIHDVVFSPEEKHLTMPMVCNALVSNNVGSAFFEANQGGEGYKDETQAMLESKYHYKMRMESAYAPTTKRKEQRIWDKAQEIREFYFRDEGCRNEMYRKFMLNLYSFTMNGKNVHDDAPDSLATLAFYISGGWGAKVEAFVRPF